jgi:quinoprotein glucose dehydrogenase
MRPSFRPLAFAVATLLPTLALAEPVGGGKTDDRYPAATGDSPEAALKGFAVAPGLQVDLWAAEPLLANPVALTFDEKGRAYVAETYRRRSSVPDIRKNMDWVVPNLALRSVEDRVNFLKQQYAPEKNLKPTKDLADQNADGRFDWKDLELEGERVKLVEDRDGDGRAETSSVFADGFSKLATGVGAGILARGGEAWYAALPDLWRLKQSEGATANREALLTGFGVHIAYSGHDMHGVKFGPDGKVYWSIADCGAHVKTKEGKVLEVPDSGAVFRANPDGTEMEVFATGLRNPQSLAFNDVGDLFTGDNNADGGDKARWEHVVEGGDYGWRIGWQFLPKLGLWNAEKLWELDRGKTALSLLPSVGHIGHGPGGIAYYPGTGLPDSYREHFFYADFPGGVRSFAIKPKGASYTVDNPKDVLQDNTPKEMTGKLLWNLYPSDVAFGTDGGVFVLDWIQGWEKTGKGRIFRVHDPVVSKSAAVLETKKLLADGMAARSEADLAALLGHVDQRVRLEAQWELAARGDKGAATLTEVAVKGSAKLARLHAIWGLGQVAAKTPGPLQNSATALLVSPETEVIAQTAKVLGDTGLAKLFVPTLVKLLENTEPRVQFFAAQALGKSGNADAVAPLIALLRRNSDQDAFVRHAAVLALSRTASPAQLTALSQDPSDAVRAGTLLALRRVGSADVIKYLADKNQQIVLEAARAIHDEPIQAAMPQLASLSGKLDLGAPVLRRAVNAAYRTGTGDDAKRLADIAMNDGAPEVVRLDAMEALAQWTQDLGRDRLVGLYRPLPPGRNAAAASQEAARIVPALLVSSKPAIQLAATETATALKLRAAEIALVQAARDAKNSGKVRAAALIALASFESTQLPEVLTAVLTERDKTLLEEARRLTAKFLPSKAVELSAAVLETGTIKEKQSALATLATLPAGDADKLIAAWLDRQAAGQVAPAVQLDLLDAASKREDATVKAKLASLDQSRNAIDPLARWRECLEGGDAKIGKEVFNEKAEAACMRCHKVSGVGGDVGPDLGGFGKKQNREYILASIVTPNATIAAGYENNLITLNDGNIVAGVVSAETADELTVTPVGGGDKVKVKKANVKQRDKIPSAMPEGLGDVLGKRDLRNGVEYLATLK